MSKVLIINGADFSANAIDRVTINDKVQITLLSEPLDGGVTDGSGEYNTGDLVSISATPNDGYYFYKWSDGILTPSRTLKVGYASKAIMAMFLEKTISWDTYETKMNLFSKVQAGTSMDEVITYDDLRNVYRAIIWPGVTYTYTGEIHQTSNNRANIVLADENNNIIRDIAIGTGWTQNAVPISGTFNTIDDPTAKYLYLAKSSSDTITFTVSV